jgi:hypothetical protein
LVVPTLKVAALAVLALALVPAAHAATHKPRTTTIPVTTPHAVIETKARLTGTEATNIFLAYPKVRDWLKHYPAHPQTQATFAHGAWTVNVWSGKAGEIATGHIDDPTGAVLDAWTGPQVAWAMARGYPGSFGGKEINSYGIWLGFIAIFLIGLIDWRRIVSWRTGDLLALSSFSVSLYFFNHGNVFTAMPLAYPPMLWLLARCLFLGHTDRAPSGRARWPIWVLAAATVFLAGFRIGLNVRASNVIDVGYSGVIGAQRIWTGVVPYGHFPVEDDRPACGPADSNGEIRDRIQTNGFCENANPLGDTYGPVAYEAYLPGFWAFGWTRQWDSLPAVHFTSILFDIVGMLGMAFAGWRFGGRLGAATLGFAWVAWPFTQYVSSSNSNDAIMPALLIWGFVVITSNFGRGVFAALSGWTKFASLLVLPLWLGYPEARRGRGALFTLLGFVVATFAAFSILLLAGVHNVPHEVRVFYDRTIGFQKGRESPFSIWDWRQYHAKGIPDLQWPQRVLEGLLVAGALVLGWWPRKRSPLRLAVYTAALLIGFEMVLTHWFYLYLPWFFPFVALALLAPPPGRQDEPAAQTSI